MCDFIAQEYSAVEKGYPVILVDEAYKGLARFIENIEQECVVLFDELDKTFKSTKENDEQAKLLSLFDGTAGGKKMYIVTFNELYGLNDYIVNRPGRFHYHFRFEYPTATEIREYLEDKLEKNYYGEIDKVIEFAGRINFNYDCLRAIAFELNQGAMLEEAITELNILNVEMMNIFAEFGKIKELSPESEGALALAKKLQDHITEHYYTCTDKILLGFETMYAGGGDFTTNIDEVGGEGTAVFAYEAIKAMVGRK